MSYYLYDKNTSLWNDMSFSSSVFLLCFLLIILCWLHPASQVLCEPLRHIRKDKIGLWASGCSMSTFKIPWKHSVIGSYWYSSSPATFFFFPSVWNIKTLLGFYKNALSYLLNLKVSSLQLSTLILKEGTLLIKTEKSYCS